MQHTLLVGSKAQTICHNNEKVTGYSCDAIYDITDKNTNRNTQEAGTRIHRKMKPVFFKNQLPHLLQLTTKLPPRGLSVAIQMLLICQNLRDCLQSET